MSDTAVLEIALQAILIAAKLCAPILLVTLAVGFGISLLQAVTHPVATNPNALLAAHAKAHGWPILNLFND